MQVLEKYFDTAFDAPDGIKKLRELILTLAMQGKLVPQDPNDQPASELLKGQSKHSSIEPNEKLFKLPNSWEWVKLGNISHIERGGSPRPIQAFLTSDNDGLNWIKIGDTDKGGKYITSTKEKIKPEGLSKTRKVYPGDFLLTNSMSFGRPYISQIEGCIHDGWLRISPPEILDKEFLYFLLSSPYVNQFFVSVAAGAVVSNLNADKVRGLVIPLPPQKEQQRIVEKINQLMALCDELEKLKEQKEAKKLTVHKSAINQLLDSKDESTSQKGWNFISNHFNDLYTVKENVSELRSAILQLAMQGKLIPQDPNDQPASELLKEIEKEKKANKVKSLEPIKSESIPYDLPNGWQWVYLNDFGVWKSGSTPSRTNSAYYGGDIPWVKSGEVKQGLIKKIEETITQKALDECSLGLNPIGSVLVAMYGANIGEVGILEVEATTNQAICACQTFSKINNQFLKFLIDSLKGYFISQGAGAAQPNISRVKIINSIVPLPPFNEQERIVEKINQLMALCDNLEKQIENSSSKQTQLLNAIMSNLGK